MPKKYFFKIFKTKWGYAGVVFDKFYIYKFLLPYPKKEKIKLFLNDGFLNLKPENYNSKNIKIGWIKNFIRDVKNYFNGKKVDFKKYKVFLNFYTEKERLVLKKLRNVSYGSVITYKKLSLISKIKNGERFVGNVMSKNRTPLIIPCHRVITSDKKIGGFRFGKVYKQKLLKLENINV